MGDAGDFGDDDGARVIVGVDDSLTGLQALREAVRFARGLSGGLRAVRACEYPSGADSGPGAGWGSGAGGGPGALWWAPPTAAQWEARETAARAYIEDTFALAMGGMPTDIPVTAMAVFAPVRDALLSCAADGDLLVVGASRRWSVSRWLPPRRPVGEFCVTRARCPVVVVPAHAAAREAEAWDPLAWIHRRHELATLTASRA